MIDRVGKQLGNYRLHRLLGRGGFADIYLGEHVFLKSLAALKILRMSLTDEERDAFLREAQTLMRLVHPNIVRVLDFAVEDDQPYLVMDYAPNGSLRERHPAGSRLPLDSAVVYVAQIAKRYPSTVQIILRNLWLEPHATWLQSSYRASHNRPVINMLSA